MISEKALEEFKKIYKEEYKKDPSEKEALDLATNLLTIFNVVYRPVKREWLKDKEKN
jgi:hypothetical protein